MRQKFLETMLYEDENKNTIIEKIKRINNSEDLYVFVYNYNWDDGFKIIETVLENENCDLSTALLCFHLGGGFKYLQFRAKDTTNEEWKTFIVNLYNNILNGKYKKTNTAFKSGLTKVQIFKLKKILSEEDFIFIEEFGDVDLN